VTTNASKKSSNFKRRMVTNGEEGMEGGRVPSLSGPDVQGKREILLGEKRKWEPDDVGKDSLNEAPVKGKREDEKLGEA